MKETPQESADLKLAFKEHFASAGYDTPLPAHLQSEADKFPHEWAEACQEWEQYGAS